MTTEDKLLLVQDLCARLPYGVQVQHITTQFSGTLHDIIAYPLYNKDSNIYDIYATTNFFGEGDCVYLEYFKPYLFPLRNITEQQVKEIVNLVWPGVKCDVYLDIEEPEVDIEFNDCTSSYLLSEIDSLGYKVIDYLNAHHFDYRGLIEKGLAIDAIGKNIY